MAAVQSTFPAGKFVSVDNVNRASASRPSDGRNPDFPANFNPGKRHSIAVFRPSSERTGSSVDSLNLRCLPKYAVFVPDHKVSSRNVGRRFSLASPEPSAESVVIPRRSMRSVSNLSRELNPQTYRIADPNRRASLSLSMMGGTGGLRGSAFGDRNQAGSVPQDLDGSLGDGAAHSGAPAAGSTEWEPPKLILSEHSEDALPADPFRALPTESPSAFDPQTEAELPSDGVTIIEPEVPGRQADIDESEATRQVMSAHEEPPASSAPGITHLEPLAEVEITDNIQAEQRPSINNIQEPSDFENGDEKATISSPASVFAPAAAREPDNEQCDTNELRDHIEQTKLKHHILAPVLDHIHRPKSPSEKLSKFVNKLFHLSASDDDLGHGVSDKTKKAGKGAAHHSSQDTDEQYTGTEESGSDGEKAESRRSRKGRSKKKHHKPSMIGKLLHPTRHDHREHSAEGTAGGFSDGAASNDNGETSTKASRGRSPKVRTRSVKRSSSQTSERRNDGARPDIGGDAAERRNGTADDQERTDSGGGSSDDEARAKPASRFVLPKFRSQASKSSVKSPKSSSRGRSASPRRPAAGESSTDEGRRVSSSTHMSNTEPNTSEESMISMEGNEVVRMESAEATQKPFFHKFLLNHKPHIRASSTPATPTGRASTGDHEESSASESDNDRKDRHHKITDNQIPDFEALPGPEHPVNHQNNHVGSHEARPEDQGHHQHHHKPHLHHHHDHAHEQHNIIKELVHGPPKRRRSLSAGETSTATNSTPIKYDLHEHHDLSEKYGKCGEVLGKGAEAVVSLAHKKSPKMQAVNSSTRGGHEKLYAIKRFRKKRKDESQRDYVKKVTTEFCISSNLHHGNIVETVDLIEDDHLGWCEVMEYVPGGCLFDRMTSGIDMDVFEVNCYFHQLINGVTYLHSMGVVHRDLKPENLLLDASACILKIADFGVSEVFRIVWETKSRKLKGLAGSEPYIAPEEFEGGEFEPTKVDIWACGIIYYTMIHRAIPFLNATEHDEQYRKFLKNRLSNFPPIDNLSSGPRRMLNSILEPDPEKRITIEGIRNDPWFAAIDFCSVESKGAHHTHKLPENPHSPKV